MFQSIFSGKNTYLFFSIMHSLKEKKSRTKQKHIHCKSKDFFYFRWWMIKQLRYNYRSINSFFIIFLEVIIIYREKFLLIQDGAKLFASVEGRKFHEAKITMYTVSSLCSYKSVRKIFSMYCKSKFIRNDIFCDLFCTNMVRGD